MSFMPRHTPGKHRFVYCGPDRCTCQANATPQLPHGVCRADDPNEEAGGIASSRSQPQAASADATDQRREGLPVSVSHDRDGTSITAGVAPNTQHSEGPVRYDDTGDRRRVVEHPHGRYVLFSDHDQLRAQLEEARRERLAARGAALRAGFRSGSLAEIIEVLSGRALAAEAALREATNKALERDQEYLSGLRAGWNMGVARAYKSFNAAFNAYQTAIDAARSLKTPPVEG